jgi:hypothetical protein
VSECSRERRRAWTVKTYDSSIKARGPCFNSPASIPSECIYVSSCGVCVNTSKRQRSGSEEERVKSCKSRENRESACRLVDPISLSVRILSYPQRLRFAEMVNRRRSEARENRGNVKEVESLEVACCELSSFSTFPSTASRFRSSLRYCPKPERESSERKMRDCRAKHSSLRFR